MSRDLIVSDSKDSILEIAKMSFKNGGRILQIAVKPSQMKTESGLHLKLTFPFMGTRSADGRKIAFLVRGKTIWVSGFQAFNLMIPKFDFPFRVLLLDLFCFEFATFCLWTSYKLCFFKTAPEPGPAKFLRLLGWFWSFLL